MKREGDKLQRSAGTIDGGAWPSSGNRPDNSWQVDRLNNLVILM